MDSPQTSSAEMDEANQAAVPNPTRSPMPRAAGDTSGPPRLLRRLGQRALVLAAWLAALLLAVGAVLRIFFHDAAVLLVWFNSFTLYVYLPAYLAAAVGLAGRRWILASLASFAVVCHLAWTAPDYVPKPAPRAATATAPRPPRLRLFYQNVWMWSENVVQTLAEIEDHQADVVIFVEYTRGWHGRTINHPTLEAYEFQTTSPRQYTGQTVVFSKLPLRKHLRHWPTGRLVLDVEVDVDGEPLRILAAHSPRPLYRQFEKYEEFWEEVAEIARADDRPTVLVGDFNSTQHSRWYAHLTSDAFRDAFRAAGRGHLTTWPNGKSWLPPIRIDHLLVSPQVHCLRIQTGSGVASDHRPVIADLEVPSSLSETDRP